MAVAPAAAAAPRRPKRWLRWLLIAPAALIALLAVALGVAVASFDPEALKPRIAAAVEARTGRQLTLAGPIGLKFSLLPTVTLQDVSLANMPGGSRPDMARVERVEAEFALLPLLSRRLDLRRLVLRSPDILLETDAEGRPNWAFAPPGPAPTSPPPAAAPPAPPSKPQGEVAASTPRPLPLSVERVTVTDARLAYRNGATGRTRTLSVERFRTEPAAGAGVLRFDGAAALDGLPIAFGGEAGGPERLFGASAASPWPVRLAADAGGAELRVEGTAAQPLRARGWRAAVSAKVPDLSRFVAVAPNVPTPPLADIAVSGTFADPGPEAGRRLPRFTDLRASVGANDLSWVWPGLKLSSLRVDAPRDDAPFAVGAEAAANDIPLRFSGTLGGPRQWLLGTPAPEPWPIDLSFGAGASTAALKGRVKDVNRGAVGFDLELTARVPDLAALSPLVGRPLPPVRDIALDSHFQERGRGFAAGAAFHGLRVTSSAGDAAGDVTYAIGQRQGPVGELASRRLDLDALLPTPAAPVATAPEAAAPPPKDGRVIPDIPMPLEVLRLVEGNLRWRFDELVAGGVPMREALVAVAVEDGRARLEPFTVTLPGGRVLLRGGADATADPPALRFSAQTEGFDLAPALAALRAPRPADGRLDVDAELRGAGRDLRAVAGSLSGHLGLALVDGAFDAALLERLPAELRRAVLPQGAPGGAIPLPCGALRVEAEDGAARVRTLLLETGIGRVGGAGGVNLKDETVALRLLPDIRLGGVQVRAPVNIAGTLAAPRFGVSPEAAAAAGLGALLSLQRTPDRDLQALAGALGGGGAGALPDCASQLAAARGGKAGAVPSRPSTPPPAAAAQPPAGGGGGPSRDLPRQAEELLRGLFGRGR